MVVGELLDLRCREAGLKPDFRRIPLPRLPGYSRGDVDIVTPIPDFASIRNLSSLSIDVGGEKASTGKSQASQTTIHVPLRLVPTSEPWRRVRAVSIPWSRAEWLQRLVYALPPLELSLRNLTTGGRFKRNPKLLNPNDTLKQFDVVVANPPRDPRVAMDRMKMPGSVARSFIRMRSPRRAPPE